MTTYELNKPPKNPGFCPISANDAFLAVAAVSVGLRFWSIRPANLSCWEAEDCDRDLLVVGG